MIKVKELVVRSLSWDIQGPNLITLALKIREPFLAEFTEGKMQPQKNGQKGAILLTLKIGEGAQGPKPADSV